MKKIYKRCQCGKTRVKIAEIPKGMVFKAYIKLVAPCCKIYDKI